MSGDDVPNDTMTSSYHEISGLEQDTTTSESKTLPEGAKKLFDRAKNWVGDLSLDGVVSHEGHHHQSTHAGAPISEDLHKKVKVSKQQSLSASSGGGVGAEGRSSSSSHSSETGTSGNPEFTDDHFGHSYLSGRCNQSYTTSDSICDLNITVNEIEVEAKKLASCVDTLTENLAGILHSLSSMTMDCVFTASDGVTQLCDTGDASIKLMYQVMAKCEELNKSVVPLYEVHKQIQDTKKLLDRVEAEMN